MRRQIDLGDDGSDDSLEDAMRDLERQLGERKRAAREEPAEGQDEGERRAGDGEAKRRFEEKREAGRQKSREEVQEALEAIGRDQREAAGKRPARARVSPIRWIVLAVVLVGAIVAGAVKMRPEPLPPPASSPKAAVVDFWGALIEGKYEAATVYYPALVDRYGSRKQASNHLQDLFGGNPPIQIIAMGEPEELPNSGDLRVSYEVCLRNGRPRTGEFILRYMEGPSPGYVIVAAP